jgi:DNA repair exonuclease SbcCD ATPase subunit
MSSTFDVESNGKVYMLNSSANLLVSINEKNQLESIKERESILKTKKERLSQLSDLLIYQIGELKDQIKSSMKLQQESVKQTKSGSQGMAMLMIDNELQQNRNRLATLEERLYIDLENQHSELQKEINDNNRDQLHQLALIDEKQKNLDKYLVENKLDIDQQKTAIAKKEAEKVKIPADREQNVEVLKQQIDVLEEQLSNIINTRAVTEPMRSQKPTSISKLMIIALAFMLATIFGFFATFIAVFRQKVRMHEVENV